MIAPETEKDTEIVHIASHLAILEPQPKEMQQATSADETLKDVLKIIIEGWPAKKDGLHARVYSYFHIRDELATLDSRGAELSYWSTFAKKIEKSYTRPIQAVFDEHVK